MDTRTRVVLRVVVAAAVATTVGALTCGPAAAAPVGAYCEQTFPAASDGRLTLDTPVVQAGTQALALLSDFEAWPQHLIGGGSGETFLSCTPWQPTGNAEAMVVSDVALFLVQVPPQTPPGTYPVSVLFSERSEGPDDPGDGVARLSTTVTVTADAVEPWSNGAACSALTGRPANVRQLGGGDGAAPGGVARLTLAPPNDAGTWFSEYDRLWFVACVDGAATPVVHEDGNPVDIDVRLPATLTPGTHVLRLWGIVDEVVWWERSITVAALAPADTSQLAVTGPAWRSSAAVGALLLLGGLAILVARRGRRAF